MPAGVEGEGNGVHPGVGRLGILQFPAPDEAFPRAAVALGALTRRMVGAGRLVAAGVALHDCQDRPGER